MDAASEPARPSSRLPLLLTLIALVAVIAVALVVVFTRGASAPLDESTPEGVVQRYVQAILDGETDAAEEYLHSELTADCEPFDYHRHPSSEEVRVTLRGTTESGDTATVRVIIAYPGGSGLLGPTEYQSEERFSLKRDADLWRITDAPWDFTICERRNP